MAQFEQLHSSVPDIASVIERMRAVADPLTHLLGSWSPERARKAARSAALVLWRLRDVPLPAEEFRKRMDAGAGLVGRCLPTAHR